jgi:hypothetical protein
MSETWNTKFGPRRVRRDPPTLKEAIAAAQGLTDELSAQIEIAASLMGLPVDAVRTEVMQAAPERKSVRLTIGSPRERGGPTRTVIVERKPARRMIGVRPG